MVDNVPSHIDDGAAYLVIELIVFGEYELLKMI